MSWKYYRNPFGISFEYYLKQDENHACEKSDFPRFRRFYVFSNFCLLKAFRGVPNAF